MASFRPETESCPYCEAKASCQIFAYYHRYLIDYVDGRPVVVQIRVLRVICSSCGATHAILFDPIIPYEQHSLFFILRVLATHFMHFATAEKTCETFEISMSTFHRWKKLYEQHRREWQGTLKSIEISLRDSILELIRKVDPFSAFASQFFEQAKMSFLQSHKNPTPYQQRSRSTKNDFP